MMALGVRSLQRIVSLCVKVATPVRSGGWKGVERVPPLSWLSSSVASAATHSPGTLVPGYDKIAELEGASEDVRKIFGLEFACQKEQTKIAVAEVMEKLQTKPWDTGSNPVQIGALTVRIRHLTEHLKINRKDKSCLRSLLRLVHRRRKLLLQVKKRDPELFPELLQTLSIRPPQIQKYAQKRRKS